jgi:hypothetical protein
MSIIAARAVVEAVINFPRQLWRVLSISRKYHRVFGYKAVIAPLVKVTKRIPAEYSRQTVQARLRRVHKLWTARVSELVARGLWYPCPYDNLTTLQLTLVRLINCRPTCCWLKGNRRVGGDLPTKIRPCGRSYFCPFCAARRATKLARRVVRGCQTYGRNTPEKYELVYRELQLLVPVVGFENHAADESVLRRNLAVLVGPLNAAQKALRKAAPAIRRKTLGSLSTIVVNTTDTDFVILVRQLFLVPKGSKNPWVKLRGAKTITLSRTSIMPRAAVSKLLAKFSAYPVGLLCGYPEFTAVVLHARHARRLLFATGVLKQEKEVRRAQKTKIASPPESTDTQNSCATHGVFM